MGNDDDIIEHRNAEGRGPADVLHKSLRRICTTIAFRITQDHYAITFGATLTADIVLTIIDAFGYPNTSLRIDIKISRVREHGRTGPQSELHAFRNLEKIESDITALLRFIKFKICAKGGRS